jgi:hypothetical protein
MGDSPGRRTPAYRVAGKNGRVTSSDRGSVSRFDDNDRIAETLEPGESILAAANMAIGHWSTDRLLKAATRNVKPPVIRLCLTERRLLQFDVQRSSNICKGILVRSTPRAEITSTNAEIGRYFWGPKYCRLTIALSTETTFQFQAAYAVKRAVHLAEVLGRS